MMFKGVKKIFLNQETTILIAILLFSLALNSIYAQEHNQRKYQTQEVENEVPVIDGIFDDDVWQTINWVGNFTQREPYSGEKPSQATKFKILYDDNDIYVAIKVEDNEPGKIEKRLTRRDDFDGDWVAIAFDSYYDKRTAFSFGVNVAGVKLDLVVSNDNEMDDTWDPVWYVKTSTDNEGWNAEMRIPLTQLRFSDKEELTWGLQVMRWLFRKEEFSAWQHIPQESSRWVSLFGELHGIKGIKPKKEIELVPYVMGNTERFKKEKGNPFGTGTDYHFSAGLDGKIAVTNDFTLNFTVNPDFGQVEADPSEVNLTAFETFFEEKRPFFIEGSNIYDYGITLGDGPMSQDNLFYSRRIGRRPHHSPDLNDDEYSDEPEQTRILGAFKLSGKTKNGWSIGVLESVTNKEHAEIDYFGDRRMETVEPFTNYFNTRVQKDFDKGNTIVGGMVSATARFINDTSVNFLNHSAYSGGFDFTRFWKDKDYMLRTNFVFSHLLGNTKSIVELQESSRRYYQRPDARHLEVDSSATTMSGHGGSIEAGKIGGGNWQYLAFFTWRSPGVELNDMGYLRQADHIMQAVWVSYRIYEPFSIFRTLGINANQWTGWNFAGTNLYKGGNINLNMQFKNYWSFGLGINRDGSRINTSELRGGPALKYPGDWNNWINIESDERKKVVFEVFMFNNWEDISTSRFFDVGLEVTYRPINALSLSVEPSYNSGMRKLQYVETLNYYGDDRYIISRLNSEVISLDFRINLSITPDLSFQYWGQPFIFAGEYSTFKRVTDPMNDDFKSRFHPFDKDEYIYDSENETYHFDENGDGFRDYSLKNPNFNVFEFRSNFVARWEYIPGSTLYFVWSQGREGDNSVGRFNFRNDIKDLYTIVPHNVFLIKFSYRLSL